MTELAKTFDPAEIEARWYAHWEERGLFRPERSAATPFTIVMPPPNVTGSLHIGHALDITLQDILVRHARLQGKDALWVVGTDHAGIATQMVVERQLDLEQKKRTDLTRDEFVERVWAWKEESGGQITQQLRRLGASCDWANERFTMDEGFSKAVTHVFVELHKRGLLYRDKRLVNWDPKFQSAISDLEVETHEVPGKFWTLRYPLADGSGFVEVATTRPETMLADMAVAVHPTDERYTALVGKLIRLPITGREIPIITDEHADPELGSGAVKITPGHDFNDYEVGKRAGFKPGDMLNMFDASAKVVQCGGIPEAFIGLDRFDARQAVVDALGEALVKVEDRTIATPFGDRSGVVIEPWLTDQWYVDAAKLAGPAIEAVKSGAIKIVPETWAKTWYNWLENIQPWCVSRQLWWGHRIPAWFDEAGEIFVAESEEQAQALAPGKTLRRDEDVLDTWFSSALWPFATLGWPGSAPPAGAGGVDSAKLSGGGPVALDADRPSPSSLRSSSPPAPAGGELARHYPNDVLISGFDILFFWDARMAMQGIEFMGAPPWKTLYLHGLVRDANGQKMSKSKGNTVDPLGLIDRFGADALRFTMAAMESQGRDIKLDEKRVEGYRNFATKLWNAARFLQGNGVGASTSIAAPSATLPVNRWIIGEVVETLAKMDQALADLRFDETADAIYHFTWGTFCDWYVELVKGAFDDETRAVAAWAFDQILVMLHPLMPFITEELWHAMGARAYDLILAHWPAPDAVREPQAAGEVGILIEIIAQVRNLRAELTIPWSAALIPHVIGGDAATLVRFAEGQGTLSRMAKLDPAIASDAVPASSAQIVVNGITIAFPLGEAIDLAAERARLEKAIAVAAKDRDSLGARLANPAFTERAKPEAVEKARGDHDARAAEAERLSAAMARLG
jgi:valyl-tRNA synthetase